MAAKRAGASGAAGAPVLRRADGTAAGTGQPSTAQLPIDSSLFFKLVRLVNLTARPFVETLSRRHALSLNEWRVMVVLASRPGTAASDVVDATGLDKMSVSRAIAALDSRGRVAKAPDPGDARRTQLRLSTEGAALFEAIGAPAAQRNAALFAGLTDGERLALDQTVDRLTSVLLHAADDGRPSAKAE